MKLVWDTGESKEIHFGYKLVGQNMHYQRPEYVSLSRDEILGLLDNPEYIKHLAGALANNKKQKVTK